MLVKPVLTSRRSIKLRRGNILTLTAFMLPMVFILSAVAINSAYMQLTKTEMMVATDAAARAGGRALSELQDVDQAKTAAQVTAALNDVAGVPLRISTSDATNQIEFGSAIATNQGRGRYGFDKKNTNDVKSKNAVANSVRITSNRSAGSENGAVQLPFPGFVNVSNWEVRMSSVATQVDRDIVLVLDRSGSMAYKTYDWPSGKNPWTTTAYEAAVKAGLLTKKKSGKTTNYYYASGVTEEMYQDWAWEEYFKLGDAPKSPWQELKIAVSEFLDVLNETDQAERVALASYSSDATLDLNLQSDYSTIVAELETLSPVGATAIGLGMQTGLPTLFNEEYARPLAAKTMIVMTDGIHNSGIDPVTVATSILSTRNITIHSITFSPDADKARMQQVATIGGGLHYHADNGEQLIDVFREIANNLPTIITQ